MKSVLMVALIGIVAFLFYQNRQKELALAEIADRENKAEASREMDQLKDDLHKAGAERDAARQERDRAKFELQAATQDRDDARHQVEAAQAEIGRLTNTIPKPVNWFEKHLEQSTGKLDAPNVVNGGVRR